MYIFNTKMLNYPLQAQSDDDDAADEVSVNMGGESDFMTEFFAEVCRTE